MGGLLKTKKNETTANEVRTFFGLQQQPRKRVLSFNWGKFCKSLVLQLVNRGYGQNVQKKKKKQEPLLG